MAIAFDNSTGGGTASGTSLTYAHTCTSADILFVAAAQHPSVGNVSGVTYNSVAMTQIDVKNGGNNTQVYLFYLLAPATGANNVVVSKTGAAEAISSWAASYTGAKQSGQPDAHATAGPTTTTSYSQSLTSIADNCWGIWALIAASGGAQPSDGANTKVRQYENTRYGLTLADTNSAKTPAGTDTMNVTSASQLYFSDMATFSPSASTSLTARTFIVKQAPNRASTY